MEHYSSPKISDLGDVRAVTAGKIGRKFDDADHKAHDFALVNTTGVCVSGDNEFPCS